MEQENKKYSYGCGCGCSHVVFAFLILIVSVIAVLGFAGYDPTDMDSYPTATTTTTISTTSSTTTAVTTDTTAPSASATATSSTTVTTTAAETTTTTRPTSADTDEAYRRRYYQLSEEEQAIYRVLQQTLEAGKYTYTFENIDSQAYSELVPHAFDAVYFDYPEYFWICHGWSYKSRFDSFEFTMMNYDYWEYTTDQNGYIAKVNAKAQEIAAKAAALPTDFDKVKYVHDYLVTHVEYDEVCLAEINQSVQRASSQQSHTVYGALVSNLAVCDGYAKTFQMIMNLLGIECEYIEGSAGGPHAWNYVKLGGENYWMDVTWDDYDRRNADGTMQYPEGVDYGYFCITTDWLDDTHTPEADFPIPDCTATEYNFFYHEKSYLETYDFDAFVTALNEQKGAQIVSVRFGSQEELNKAKSDLFTGLIRRFYTIPGYENADIRYAYDSQRYILMIYFE